MVWRPLLRCWLMHQARNDDVARMHNRVTFSLSHSYTWLHIRLRSYVYAFELVRMHTLHASRHVSVKRKEWRKEKKTRSLRFFLPETRGNAVEGRSSGFRCGENSLFLGLTNQGFKSSAFDGLPRSRNKIQS